MSQKPDWDFLPKYYSGDNLPVGIWIKRHYRKLFFSSYRICKETETAEDAIQNVALEMCKWKTAERPLKFRPTKNNIVGALLLRVRRRTIDLFRKKKQLQPIGGRDFPMPEKDEDEILFEERMEIINSIKTNILTDDELLFFEKMFEYGFGKLKPLADELGISTEEARRIKYGITRRIKRALTKY